ncbi:MAG: hypothetical protein ACLP7F_24135 [Acidimicrobiales bacterium]|jgi:hypothetical protein
MAATTDLWDEVLAKVVTAGTLSLWWLYQAGIVVKSPGRTFVLNAGEEVVIGAHGLAS